MKPIEHNILGFEYSARGRETFQAIDPATGAPLEGNFVSATEEEVDEALKKARRAFASYRNAEPALRARFLRAIAEELEGIADALVGRVMSETALPEGRVRGELGRTTFQLRLFAQLVEEGSYVEAVIDHGDPQRAPLPKPDVRRRMVALGPVVVFTASNFPLAFSTAGGDTASALAAGCPVVVKAHESHPGTNALVAECIRRAAEACSLPDGVFSSLNGKGHAVGQRLVSHPETAAVAFTGSFRGGKALYDLAQRRPNPIPVFAEMGSTNPVLLLPGALEAHGEDIAGRLAQSINLGAGQFCTNPGLQFALQGGATKRYLEALRQALRAQSPATMLNRGIYENYCRAARQAAEAAGVQVLEGEVAGAEAMRGQPLVATAGGEAFLANPALHEEVFGPFSLVVLCQDAEQLRAAYAAVPGQLTTTFWAEASDGALLRSLLPLAEEKAGRILLNGVPTGVEVCPAMQHGGPFPATTDPRFTSVGTGAVRRFLRPVAYQDFPEDLLPDELKEDNPRRIWRLVDGQWQR